jgi:hypothetical protein
MIMISSREDFWSGIEFSNTDFIREVDLTDDSLGKPMSEERFLAAIKGKKIVVLIHGYNNEEDD